MRVIRTDMYFAASDIAGLAKNTTGSRNPGFSVAWFKVDGYLDISPYDIKGFVTLASVDEQSAFSDRGEPRPPTFTARRFADLCIRSSPFVPNTAHLDLPENDAIVSYIINAPIVVEHSPASTEQFGGLLTGAANVTIGLYMGTHVVAANDPLMFLTVPGGIIIAGAAIGVSRGLMNGLNIAIESAIKRLSRR